MGELFAAPRRRRAEAPRDGEEKADDGVVMSGNPWYPFGEPRVAASVRLFCFPFAGGGASLYREWRRRSPPGLDLCPVQLPGREARIREAPLRRMGPLVEEVWRRLEPWANRPYALFGHSMGALIVLELAHHARRKGHPLPAHLIVSGARPPHLREGGLSLHKLPDREFVQALRDLGGTPEAVLAHPELMDLLLPALRADFEVSETYGGRDLDPLHCPITAFGGDMDPEVPPEMVEEWRLFSSAPFESVILPGGHFFMDQCADEIIRRVARKLGCDDSPSGLGTDVGRE